MVNTKYLVDNYNLQTLIWDGSYLAVWTVRTTLRTAWLSFQMALLALVYAVIVTGELAALPYTWVAVKALALTAVLVGAFVVTVTSPLVTVCGLGLVAFVYATWPKAGK